MKFKKLISIGLALTMTTACLPVVASADTAPSYETNTIAKSDIAYPVEGGNIYFDPTTGTITGADETVTKADIPNQINGTPVTSIAAYAFEGIQVKLTEITIPDSVVNIGREAFFGCTNLQKIEVGGGNTAYSSMDGVLYNKDKSCLITVPGGIADYEIPDSVRNIADSAFAYCTKLKEITIPNGVESIGWSAFCGCEFKEITIPDSVISICDNPFSICPYLKKIEVSEGNAFYSSLDGALYNRDKSHLIAVPNSFYNFVIPDSVTSIGARAFRDCDNLDEITIPNKVTSIGEDAFGLCDRLKEIIIPYGVTELIGTFYGCVNLKKVTISDSVTNIGEYTFENCHNLTEITIPKSVISIGDYAFEGCNNLTEITIPKSVISFGDDIFNLCTGLKTVNCYKGSTADDTSLYPEGVTIVYLDDEPTIPDVPNKPVVPEGLGDVDGDGAVTSNDAAKAYVLAAAKDYDAKADVDGNKAVEVKDAEEIMKKVMRASHKFPLETAAA